MRGRLFLWTGNALAGACVVFTYILPWLLRPRGK